MKDTISGWGRIPVTGREQLSEDLGSLTQGAVLSRGLGRSYGDSAVSYTHLTLPTKRIV